MGSYLDPDGYRMQYTTQPVSATWIQSDNVLATRTDHNRPIADQFRLNRLLRLVLAYSGEPSTRVCVYSEISGDCVLFPGTSQSLCGSKLKISGLVNRNRVCIHC